ncbi:MAG: hypothetical protein ACFCU1_08585 [Sumerlaeia bacterium]
MNKGYAVIPLWIDHSGLPKSLTSETKSPLTWFLLKHLIQLDCSKNTTPGVVECSLVELSESTGMETKVVSAQLKKLRKQTLVRCFLPDNDEEPALIQILSPLETPINWKTIQEQHTQFRGMLEHEFRYATISAAEQFATEHAKQTKFQQVLDLYLNLVSMKLNQFVQDEIALIAEVYDYKLVQKVFLQARQKEIQNLGWIIRQIREETLQKKRIKETAEKVVPKIGSSEPESPTTDSGW